MAVIMIQTNANTKVIQEFVNTAKTRLVIRSGSHLLRIQGIEISDYLTEEE